MPPFTGVAVKVTVLPSQIAPAGLEETLILTGTVGVTSIVIIPDVAGEPVAQGAVAVKMH